MFRPGGRSRRRGWRSRATRRASGRVQSSRRTGTPGGLGRSGSTVMSEFTAGGSPRSRKVGSGISRSMLHRCNARRAHHLARRLAALEMRGQRTVEAPRAGVWLGWSAPLCTSQMLDCRPAEQDNHDIRHRTLDVVTVVLVHRASAPEVAVPGTRHSPGGQSARCMPSATWTNVPMVRLSFGGEGRVMPVRLCDRLSDVEWARARNVAGPRGRAGATVPRARGLQLDPAHGIPNKTMNPAPGRMAEPR